MGFNTLPPPFQPVNKSADAIPRAQAWTQVGAPTTTSGFSLNSEVLDSETGLLYELQLVEGSPSWVNVANLKGAKGDPGDTVLTGDDLAVVVEQVLEQAESDIDPVLLFENAIA